LVVDEEEEGGDGNDGGAVPGADGTSGDDEAQRERRKTTMRPPTAIECLIRTLEWSHLCPTGPSSVPTVPHTGSDPMVLPDRLPDVYFCGNCDRFDTCLVQPIDEDVNGGGGKDEPPSPPHVTRLIAVPDFSRTGQVVLVQLDSLQVRVLQFVEQ
jgi:DNA polymerase delta subunit 2